MPWVAQAGRASRSLDPCSASREVRGTKGRASTEEIAGRYDLWSPFYDLADRIGPLGGSERKWRGLAVEKLNSSKGWVLDAACGTGVMLPILEEKGFRGRVLLIDASRKMVRKACSRAAEAGIRASVIVGDVNRLPLKRDSLGSMLCIFSLTTVNRPSMAISELSRTGTDGSRLVVLDSERPRGRLARILYPLLVPISRIFCHTHIDRDIRALIESTGAVSVEDRESFFGGMVSLYSCRNNKLNLVKEA